MSNFLTHPNLETIEASLIIGNVLSYNMNPGVAYIFLGMVIRMAFSIGLQMNTAGFSEHENWLRRRVWWALAWQDSHFSISYDRPSASVLCQPDIPYQYGSAPGNRSYAESMYNIIRLTQEIIRERSFGSRSTWTTIQKYKETVNAIVKDGVPHLRERSLCAKTTQHLERLALKLHSSYMTSELCRPALKEGGSDGNTPNLNPAQSPPGRRKGSQSSAHSPTQGDINIGQLRRECIRSLEGTVEAYVELYSLSQFAARSWVGIQRTISAAFLLGTIPETNQEPRVLRLLQNLENCISKRTTDDPTFETLRTAKSPTHGGVPLTEAPHWARSMTRSLNALGKLNATLAGHKAGKSYSSSSSLGRGGEAGYPTPSTGSFASMQSQVAMNALRSQQQQQQHQHQQYQQQLPPMQLKQEGYSPSMAGTGMGGGMMGAPITPDGSTGSSGGGEWNYGNLQERSLEYIQPALWK
jgi:hypothetical protein